MVKSWPFHVQMFLNGPFTYRQISKSIWDMEPTFVFQPSAYPQPEQQAYPQCYLPLPYPKPGQLQDTIRHGAVGSNFDPSLAVEQSVSKQAVPMKRTHTQNDDLVCKICLSEL
jgi:hypothetical protein